MSLQFRTRHGGRIDRARPLRFTFDGRRYTGLQGDTLASALLANGIHLVGRSFKYHRPRGLLSAGSDEPNALVSIGQDEAHHTPNRRATEIELFHGLRAHSQNRWPGLRVDAGAINDVLSPLLPAGFYYKTFMWPQGAWDTLYEPAIRRAAGLGRAPTLPDPDHYANHFAHTDILVVGAGPAGLAATLAALDTGASVILCDEQSEPGGSLLAETSATIDGHPAQQWLAATLATLRQHPRLTLLPRTTAFGYFAANMIGLAERVTDHLADPDPALPRERLWQVRAAQVVLATGAIERPLVFPGNDRPGIMLADAGRIYLNRYGVLPGRRIVVVTAHDAAYRAALDLHAAGARVLIVDTRPAADGPLPRAARAAGLPVLLGMTIAGTRGRTRVSAIRIAPVRHGRVGPSRSIPADLVLMSGGYTPTIHLFSQSGGKLRWDPDLEAYLPGVSAQRERSVGACRGDFGLAAALPAHTVARAEFGQGGTIGALPHYFTQDKAFVDFQNDVTSKDLVLAAREGFRSIEHVKRYTTTGMATDQGKTSNLNALGIVAQALGRAIPEIGLTTFRMPYTPVTFGALAGPARGALFEPARHTPIHDWAAAHGAVFENVSLWRRARYFPEAGETMDQAVQRECLAVRRAAGLFDASTLGKIEIVGPDAAEFLDRVYINAWSKLRPGRLRYGIMLREDGFILDDGIVARLAPGRFHVTTTTGGAPRVLALMEDYLQTEWPGLDVWLTSTTEQWAVIALQGPLARSILAPLAPGVDLSPDALPHMAAIECDIAGIPARLFRISFTGELGYEINVPAGHGPTLWQALHDAGQPHGLTPYGTEAMHVLRAEKGYVIVGQDTDGTATPDDAGLAWAIGRAKPDFIGKRSLARPQMTRPDRRQLVGLLTEDPAITLEEGAQLVADPDQPIPMTMLGHVTSAYRSPILGCSIALAMLEAGRARHGQRLFVPMPGGPIPVTVTAPVFYDVQGTRLHA